MLIAAPHWSLQSGQISSHAPALGVSRPAKCSSYIFSLIPKDLLTVRLLMYRLMAAHFRLLLEANF